MKKKKKSIDLKVTETGEKVVQVPKQQEVKMIKVVSEEQVLQKPKKEVLIGKNRVVPEGKVLVEVKHKAYSFATKNGKRIEVPAHSEYVLKDIAKESPKVKKDREVPEGKVLVEVKHKAYSYVTKAGKLIEVPSHSEFILRNVSVEKVESGK